MGLITGDAAIGNATARTGIARDMLLTDSARDHCFCGAAVIIIVA